MSGELIKVKSQPPDDFAHLSGDESSSMLQSQDHQRQVDVRDATSRSPAAESLLQPMEPTVQPEASSVNQDSKSVNQDVSPEVKPEPEAATTEAQPVEHVATPGVTPVKKAATTEAQPAEQAAKTEAKAAEQAAKIDARPVEHEATPGATPVKKAATTEAKLAEQVAKTNPRPVKQAATPRATPIKKAAKTEAQPAKQVATPGATPVKKAATTEVQPAEQAATTEVQPAEQAAKTEAQPAKQAAKTEVQPAEQAAKTEFHPAEEAAKTEAKAAEQDTTFGATQFKQEASTGARPAEQPVVTAMAIEHTAEVEGKTAAEPDMKLTEPAFKPEAQPVEVTEKAAPFKPEEDVRAGQGQLLGTSLSAQVPVPASIDQAGETDNHDALGKPGAAEREAPEPGELISASGEQQQPSALPKDAAEPAAVLPEPEQLHTDGHGMEDIQRPTGARRDSKEEDDLVRAESSPLHAGIEPTDLTTTSEEPTVPVPPEERSTEPESQSVGAPTQSEIAPEASLSSLAHGALDPRPVGDVDLPRSDPRLSRQVSTNQIKTRSQPIARFASSRVLDKPTLARGKSVLPTQLIEEEEEEGETSAASEGSHKHGGSEESTRAGTGSASAGGSSHKSKSLEDFAVEGEGGNQRTVEDLLGLAAAASKQAEPDLAASEAELPRVRVVPLRMLS